MKRYKKYKNNLPSDLNDNLRKFLTNFDCRSLSNKTTNDLIVRCKDGDRKAYDTLVKGYMKFIIKIAQNFNVNRIVLDDLIQEGFWGLKYAIEHYNPSYHIFFNRYAGRCIKSSMLESIVFLTQVITFPPKIQHSHKKVWNYAQSFEQYNEYLPSVNEIVENIIDDFDLAKDIYQLPRDLTDTTYFMDDLDFFVNDTQTIDDSFELENKREYIQYLIDQLTPNEKFILSKLYGLEGVDNQLSQYTIGSILGLSRERIRQISVQTVLKLRENNKYFTRKDPNIGDIILLSSSDQLGKVIDIIKTNDGSSILVLIMESGNIETVNDKSLYLLLPNVTGIKGVEIDVKEFNGVKVGDKILYKRKIAQVYKIINRDSCSSLLIKYRDGYFDYILNKKSEYDYISYKKKSIYNYYETNSKEKELSLAEEVMIGDIIIYNSIRCNVIGKKALGELRYLKVKYNDGTIKYLKDNQDNYKILLCK